MGSPSDNLQNKYSYFHSVGKTLTEESQFTFNSAYKSGHVIFPADVLTDDIPYLSSTTEVDAYISGNPGILKKYTLKELTELTGSNGQSWYIEDGGQWIKPIMVPSLAPDPTPNDPSNGFIVNLYESDDTFIPPTDGVFWIDAFQGLVKFEEGFTPSDQGYGNIKISCYAYIGGTLSEEISGGFGVSDFLSLTDTPSSYAGSSGYILTVNGSEDAIEFIPATSTGISAVEEDPTPTLGGDLFTNDYDIFNVGDLNILSTTATVNISGVNTAIQGLIYPTTDGTSGQFITTDGNGNLSFATITANDVYYDNSSSINITGDTVQEALDQIDSLLENDALPKHGTTAERNALATLLDLDNVGHQFWDTDLEQLYVWTGNLIFQAAVITYQGDRGIRDYLTTTTAEVTGMLADDYRKGDRWTDATTNICTVRVCKADPITNTLSDWIKLGLQG